jgi:hypothetical protein
MKGVGGGVSDSGNSGAFEGFATGTLGSRTVLR